MVMITRTLGEVCDEVGGIIRTGPFGSQLHESDYREEGTPVIMPKDIVASKVSADSIARIGKTDVARLSQHVLKRGEIVYGRRGDIGRRALITEREAGWLCGTGCLRVSLGETVIDPQFLFYYLGQPKVIEAIANQAVGATMPNLNTGIIRSIPIAYPPLPIQRRIASILSAYDDLIENNTRRIKILEQMAQVIYREWFVEFRAPGVKLRKATSDEKKVTGKDRFPVGWRLVKTADAVWINPATKVSKDGEKPFIPMSSLPTDSMLINDIEYRTGNSGSKFKNNDTLFARITPCLENGKTAYVQFLPSDDAVAFGSTEFIVLRSKTVCPEFVYLMARSNEFRDNAIKSMSGATGRQRVQEACFDRFFFAQPDSITIASFAEMVSPMFRSIHVLAQKNANLRQTRDLLLPRLVGGEVDVEKIFINADGG